MENALNPAIVAEKARSPVPVEVLYCFTRSGYCKPLIVYQASSKLISQDFAPLLSLL